jgi:ElaB/YqjD/DUF883 family membrane-anchored ribosome-binding protein
MATSKTKSEAAKPKKATAAKPAAQTAPKQTLRDQAQTVVGEARDKAKDAANQGKGKAAGAMNGLAEIVENIAKTIDEKAGAQYGDYARKAASAVSGAAESLQSKEVEELVDNARDFVRKRPAVAIGAAAAVGFVLTRLIKASSDEDDAA